MIAVILRQRNNDFIMAVLGQKKLWSLSKMTIKLWRRRRDLNPRAGYPTYALSRGASSANLSISPCRKYHSVFVWVKWRREWDSNPRLLRVTGFQDQLLKPLGHLSTTYAIIPLITVFVNMFFQFF